MGRQAERHSRVAAGSEGIGFSPARSQRRVEGSRAVRGVSAVESYLVVSSVTSGMRNAGCGLRVSASLDRTSRVVDVSAGIFAPVY
jgi:hypothetical protein